MRLTAIDDARTGLRKPPRGLLVAALAALLAMTLGEAPPLSAQPAPGDPPPPSADEPDGPEPSDEAVNSIRERIRIMRAWRLTEVIDLDEATAVQLFEHLDSYDRRIHTLQDELSNLGRQLRVGLADDSTGDADLRGLIEQVTQIHLQIEQLKTEMVVESGDFLDARQQAAFMLFVPEFDRQIQQLMRDARRRGGRMRGGPDAEGGDPRGPRGGRRRGAGRRGVPPGLDAGE